MRILRSHLSCLAVLAGIAAVSITTSDSALAARARASVGGPVCGTRADGPKNYDSARAAMADGAKVAHPGQCVFFCQGLTAALITQPLCGRDPLNHAMMTYPNNCEAENAHAIWIHNGPCK